MPALLALPAIEIAFLALLAVLLFYGTVLLVKWLTLILPTDLPVIGDRLVRAVERASSWAQGSLRAAVKGQLAFGARVIRYPVASLKGHLNDLGTVASSLANFASHIVRVVIPEVRTTLVNRIAWFHNAAVALITSQSTALFNRMNNLHAAAIAYALAVQIAALAKADHIFALAQSFTRSEIAALSKKDAAAIAQAVQYTKSVETVLMRREDQLYHQAVNLAAGATSELSHTVSTLFGQAVQHADSAARAAALSAIAAVNAEAAGVITLTWPGLADDLQSLEKVIGSDLAQIREAIGEIDLSKTRDIAAALAVTTAISAATLRYMRDCGIPNCKNLGAFGHVLQALEGLVAGEALFEFVHELAHDPEEAAHTVIDETGHVVSSLADHFQRLIGVF